MESAKSVLVVQSNPITVEDVTTLKDLGNRLTIDFSKDNSTVVTVYEVPGTNVKTISRVVPQGMSVLIAEVGEIDMITVLNGIKGVKIEVPSRFMIAGINNQTPHNIKIGMTFFPKARDSYQFREVWDPTNHLSLEALAKAASDDKALLAATTIAFNKEKSKFGLQLNSEVADSQYLEKLDKQNPGLDSQIYKGKKLPFVNYKLIDYTNIDALLYVIEDTK